VWCLLIPVEHCGEAGNDHDGCGLARFEHSLSQYTLEESSARQAKRCMHRDRKGRQLQQNKRPPQPGGKNPPASRSMPSPPTLGMPAGKWGFLRAVGVLDSIICHSGLPSCSGHALWRESTCWKRALDVMCRTMLHRASWPGGDCVLRPRRLLDYGWATLAARSSRTIGGRDKRGLAKPMFRSASGGMTTAHAEIEIAYLIDGIRPAAKRVVWLASIPS